MMAPMIALKPSWQSPAVAVAPVWSRPNAGEFATLYESNVGRIYRHVIARVGDPILAEDLTAQTFLKAWQSIDSYRPVPGRPFIAWLFAIANNLVVDHFRRRGRELTGITHDPAASQADDPERSALQADLRDGIRGAIAALKPSQQLVVTLRLVDGADYAEISAIMDKSPGALRVLFCRAVQALRTELRRRGLAPEAGEVD
jgi:RNA polymerase sigma-70 factor (ECF subfamily)